MHTVSVKMAVTITFAFALLPLGPKLSACSDRHGTCRCKCWLRICSRVSGKTLASRVTFGPLNAVVTKFETVARWLRGTWELSLGAFGKALDKFVQVLTSTVQEDRDCTRITLPCRDLSEFRGTPSCKLKTKFGTELLRHARTVMLCHGRGRGLEAIPLPGEGTIADVLRIQGRCNCLRRR
jgi:hypothetical protein